MDNELWWNDALKSSAEGVVYYGTPKGLAIYRPKVVETDVVSPSPRFRNIAFEQDDNGYNELNVSFAAMSFTSEQKVTYKTRVLGYSDWTEPGIG